MNEARMEFKKKVVQSIIVMLTVMGISGTFFCGTVFAQPANDPAVVNEAAMEQQHEMSMEKADVMKFGLLAAAIAFGLGAVGAGIAISHVGAAAMGAIAEKPQMAGQALIFVALAEGLVVFGFITALMILGKV